eukprot:IDg16327t1
MDDVDAEPPRTAPCTRLHDALAHVLYMLIALVLTLSRSLGALLESLRNLLMRAPRMRSAPAHVALAGSIQGHAHHVARLALAAERAGASRFSVCACDAADFEKACAQAGVRIPVRVRPFAPHSPVVSAARTLARIAPGHRSFDLRDTESVVRALDDWHFANELESEPDVLVIAQPSEAAERTQCFASFSVWQLRLTQFRFSHCPVQLLSDASFLELVCSATNVAKRFGR